MAAIDRNCPTVTPFTYEFDSFFSECSHANLKYYAPVDLSSVAADFDWHRLRLKYHQRSPFHTDLSFFIPLSLLASLLRSYPPTPRYPYLLSTLMSQNVSSNNSTKLQLNLNLKQDHHHEELGQSAEPALPSVWGIPLKYIS